MRICVIGNSHVAALREALGPGSTLGGHQLGFYSLPGGTQPQLQMIDGRLCPVTAGVPVVTDITGADADGLDLADYQLVCISACGWFAARNEFIDQDVQSHPCGFLACADWACGPGGEGPANTRIVSRAVFGAVVDGYVRDHASINLASLLEERYAGRVLMQPWPAPDRRLKTQGEWFLNVRHGARAAAAWQSYFDAQYAALVKITNEAPGRRLILDYPVPEVLSDGFMDGQWCMPDPWHANKAYGALVLQQISDALDARRLDF